MKSWILAALLIGGAALGAYLWNPWLKASVEAPSSTRPTTALVESRSIRFFITAAGDIGPAEQVSVRPEINGRIATLEVDIGDKIKKGTILFTLDDKDLQTERASRLTDIERARLQLERAERNYERSKRLFQDRLISQELIEDTKTEFELAKNSLDRSEKELRQVEDRLTKTKIAAPFDCTVLTRPVSVGQAVSGSGGFNSGTEVLSIADLSAMVINAHINQADVTRLTHGQEVEVQIESIPGLKLKGIVDRIAPQTTLKSNVKGYAARIALKKLDSRVLPGMTANLSIPVASAENALAVPLGAIFTEQGERFAYVKTGDQYEKRPVEIGVYDYDYAEVLKGLAPGESVSLEAPPGASISSESMGAGGRAPGGNGGRSAATPTPGSGGARTNNPSGGSRGGAPRG